MKDSTVVNCFSKARISNERKNAAFKDDDDLFKKLQEQMDKLAVRAANISPDQTTADEITSPDDNVSSTYWELRLSRTFVNSDQFSM